MTSYFKRYITSNLVGLMLLSAYAYKKYAAHAPEHPAALILSTACEESYGIGYAGGIALWLKGEGRPTKTFFSDSREVDDMIRAYNRKNPLFNPQDPSSSEKVVLPGANGGLTFHPALERCGTVIRNYDPGKTLEENIRMQERLENPGEKPTSPQSPFPAREEILDVCFGNNGHGSFQDYKARNISSGNQPFPGKTIPRSGKRA